MHSLLRHCTLLVAVFLCYSTFGNIALEAKLKADFAAKLDILISQMNIQLSKVPKEQSIGEIHRIAEREIVELWDARSTLLGLIGRKSWNKLSPLHQEQLDSVFRETMTRYFMEAFGYYSEQPIEIKSVKLNRKATKGWLKLVIKLEYLPDFQVDIGISKRGSLWLYRDIRVQGISYINLKRQYFQGTIAKNGVKHLINEMREKNKAYFTQFTQLAHRE